MILAEIITIGDELLIGQVVDTNSAWMGQKLSEIGIQVKNLFPNKPGSNIGIAFAFVFFIEFFNFPVVERSIFVDAVAQFPLC